MNRALVTGATGFVGTRLCEVLSASGYRVVAAVHRKPGPKSPVQWHAERVVEVGELGPESDWSAALDGVDTVFHLAARVHVMRERNDDPLAAFRSVNAAGTVQLAREAARCGVRRFIYISSIKVNGEQTFHSPFTADQTPAPEDAYAISKYEAENGLMQASRNTGIEVVIVRPPLVYGPGVKGNFFNLLRAVDRGVPMPFASVDNRRSLVGLDNLVDLLRVCALHPNAAGQVFLVSDGEDLSTPELIQRVAISLSRKARLLSIPTRILRTGMRFAGRESLYRRLCGSLVADISKTRGVLEWDPPVSINNGLKETASWYFGIGNNNL